MNCIFEFLTTKSVFTDKWFLKFVFDFLSFFIKRLNRYNFSHFSEKLFFRKGTNRYNFSEKLFNSFQFSEKLFYNFHFPEKLSNFVSVD